MNKRKSIPDIRFPDFNIDWDFRRLGDEVEFFSGLTYSPDNIVKKNGTFVLRSSNVKNGEIIETDNVYVENEAVNSINVQVGDIIVVVRNGSRSLIGKHATIKKTMKNTVIGAFMTGIHSEHSSFVNALLDTRQFEVEIHKNLGATINQITVGNFKKMEFFFHLNSEQEKIGSFFNKLDQTIVLQQQLLNDHKQLKKAMLQKMFPQKGESVPRVRFAGFTDNWEQRKLGEVSPLRGGFAFQSTKFQLKGIPIIRITNILSNERVGGNYVYYEQQENDSKYSLPDKSAILAMSGATTGKVSVLDNPNNEKIYQNQRVGYFKDLGIVNYTFISTIVKSNLFINQLKSVLVAGAQPNISSKEIDEIYFYFPTEKEEQTKIGDFFKQLDETIVLHEKKLETYQNLKKAMLQKMFV